MPGGWCGERLAPVDQQQPDEADADADGLLRRHRFAEPAQANRHQHDRHGDVDEQRGDAEVAARAVGEEESDLIPVTASASATLVQFNRRNDSPNGAPSGKSGRRARQRTVAAA